MMYRNPVYSHDFADPFVLKYRGGYWAYCTGFQPDGRVFGILRSDDLVHWDFSGGAMDPLPGGHTCYWAPEVTYEDDGSFLMYYSVGNEEHMVIRVARADHPAGPFVDVGIELTEEPFAIDAHVFNDDDGGRYLFYATDFMNHTHVGTGTVVAKMKDPYFLASSPLPVTRARYDWQVYDPKRESKGGVRWHTVEGPFILKRKGIYYEMFSGGNWQNITYGVSFATSDRVLRDDEWEQHADGEKALPILRTIPGKVIGPGHNSVVRGPNNRDLFCVYHEWVNNERVLAIDRLDWRGSDMLLLGPTITEQSGPFPPERISLTEHGEELRSKKNLSLASPSCLIEFCMSLKQGESIDVGLEAPDGSRVFEEKLECTGSLAPNVWHNVRLKIDWRSFTLRIGDNFLYKKELKLSAAPADLQLSPVGAPQVTPLELTYGWEYTFESTDFEDLTLRGWQAFNTDDMRLTGFELVCDGLTEPSSISKPLGTGGGLELVVNVRLSATEDASSNAEIVLDDEMSLQLTADAGAELIRLTHKSVVVAELHPDVERGIYHQLRFLYQNGKAEFLLDGSLLSTLVCSTGQHLALRGMGGAAFEMVRATGIASA